MEQIIESFISIFRRFSGSYLSLFRRLGHAFPSLMRMLGRVFPSLLRATSYAAPFLLREGSDLVEGRVRSHLMSGVASPMATGGENPILHHLQAQSESVLWNVKEEYLSTCGISRLQCSSEDVFYHCDQIVTQIMERQNGKEVS